MNSSRMTISVELSRLSLTVPSVNDSQCLIRTITRKIYTRHHGHIVELRILHSNMWQLLARCCLNLGLHLCPKFSSGDSVDSTIDRIRNTTKVYQKHVQFQEVASVSPIPSIEATGVVYEECGGKKKSTWCLFSVAE